MFEIVMGIDDFLIQLVKYCKRIVSLETNISLNDFVFFGVDLI